MKTIGMIALATLIATGAALAQGSGGGGGGGGGTETGPSGTSDGKEAGSKGR